MAKFKIHGKTLADVYQLAARKCMMCYVPADPESEEILAMELASIKRDPITSHGPVLEAIGELFPDGILPKDIAFLKKQLEEASREQRSYLGQLYSRKL